MAYNDWTLLKRSNGISSQGKTEADYVRGEGVSSLLAVSGLVFAASSAATFYFCLSMDGGMDMPGNWTMSMMWMRMPGQTWLESGLVFVMMWLVMMVAMMLPSALPMLLSFRRAFAVENQRRAGISTLLVGCGYFAVWTGIGVAVYAVGIFWAVAVMRSSGLSFAVPALTGACLVLAGAFQFSRWKMDRLNDCRNPLACSMSGMRTGALSHGFRQGWCCAICCSGLMLTLLVLGVMKLPVMVTIAAVIGSEKALPKPKPIVWLAGALAVGTGMALLLNALR